MDVDTGDQDRVCPSCSVRKPVAEFHPRSVRTGGPCRACRAEENRKFRASREGYFRHLVRNLSAATKKHRYKVQGPRVQLYVRDLVEIWDKQDGRCALSGVKMSYDSDMGPALSHALAAVIDVIRPGDDVVKDNVRLVCRRIKRMKGPDDPDSFRTFCAMVARKAGNAETDVAEETSPPDDVMKECDVVPRQSWADATDD
eukprot:jgi/Mesvir1/5653/Mv15671-RA.1